MDTTTLHAAYRALLDAAATLAVCGDTGDAPAGQWNAEQILAHITLVDAATLAAGYCVAAGSNATFDNRASLDAWSIERAITRAGGSAGLQERLRLQGQALCALGDQILGESELDSLAPTLLLSAGTLVFDQPVALRALITGLAEDHLPRHTAQLNALHSPTCTALTSPSR